MKYLLILSFICIFPGFVFSQLGMGEWRMHVSPKVTGDLVYSNKTLYTLLEKGLFEYDLSTGEQTIWTAADYLSDVNPTAIAANKASNEILIGYQNGNLDLLKSNTIYNLPFLLQASVNGLKRINQIVVKDNLAYLATGVGIVVLDIKKKEVKDTYHPTTDDVEFLDITFHQGKIYVITEESVYSGSESNTFLADPGQWTKLTAFEDYTDFGKYTEIESFNDNLFVVFKNETFGNSDTLYKVENNIPVVFDQGKEFYSINGKGDEFLVATFDGITIYDENLGIVNVIFQYGDNISPRPKYTFQVKDSYFVSDRNLGLIKLQHNYQHYSIGFEGPRFNSAYRLEWLKDKLVVACGGFTGTHPKFSLEGGAYLEDRSWKSIPIPTQSLLQGENVWDFIATSINPLDKSVIAFSTLSEVPIILVKDAEVKEIHRVNNSMIEGDSDTGWGYVTDVQFDEDGNLWVANAYGNRPLKVLAKNGTWLDFDLGNLVKQHVTKRLIIDKNNVKWMGTQNAGLVAFDEGASLEDIGDDRYKVFNTGKKSGDLPSNTIEAIASDIENNIWVGTPEGMRVLYNTANVLDAEPGNYNFQKLLIQYGANVEIVLGTTHITSIKVDGGNRKWIGTATSGVFLISPDGLEVERNFTAENSPLLSNTIYDIAIDHSNGEVFFATQEGIISYRSDASQGDMEYENVIVFPNPVKPDYFGPITIQGIAYDSDVKITDISGKLVYKTRSHGGTATWNGNTINGERAATGVYLIWTSIDDHDFKGRKVGKVVLIN